jgi:hypothetical protein
MTPVPAGAAPSGAAPARVRDLAGAWRRTRLVLPDGSADSNADRTTVTWLQATSFYVDLRQPPERPSFAGVRGRDAMSPEQQAWVSSQEGFAGCLVQDGAAFTWHRELDLQPPGAFLDEATLRYQTTSEEVLIEDGIHQSYAEHWRALGVASSPRWGVRVSGEGDQLGMLIRVGDWFGWACGPSTATAASTGTADSPWSRTEISLGVIRDGEWTITSSSLPFREGTGFAPRVTGSVVVTSGLSAAGQPIAQQWDLLAAEGEI